MPVTIVRIFPREEITHKIRETFYRTSPPFFPINFKNLFYFIETIHRNWNDTNLNNKKIRLIFKEGKQSNNEKSVPVVEERNKPAWNLVEDAECVLINVICIENDYLQYGQDLSRSRTLYASMFTSFPTWEASQLKGGSPRSLWVFHVLTWFHRGW